MPEPDQLRIADSPEPTRRMTETPPQHVGNLNRRMTFVQKASQERGRSGSATGHTFVVNGDCEANDQPCEKCCETYYEWQDLQLPSAGVHDGHFTAGEVFVKMLRDERIHSKEQMAMAYGPNVQFNDSLEFILPSERMVKLRNDIVNSIIFRIGNALKQSSITRHLAVRYFDIAFVRQQEYDKNDLDSTVTKVVKETLIEKADARNEPKNL